MAELQLVVFRLGREQFAAPITRVREILRPVRVALPRETVVPTDLAFPDQAFPSDRVPPAGAE